MTKFHPYILAVFGAFLALSPIASAAEKPSQPNILLVLTDDLGFSDLGCYGSEIDTPNLDRLASQGVRFSQFYNTAKCHSSRVSLLTGRWCQQAGDIEMSRAVTIPEVLAPAGYFTAISGKWHLDKEPTDFGFQRYFGHLSGATNYYKGDTSFRLNGKPWSIPEKGFYTTVANVDHALKFINEARSEKKPWFVYLPLNAPHAPLQPLKQDYEKYQARYIDGWDTMRAARLEKQKKLGIFPAKMEIPTRPDHVPAWLDLPPDVRDWESRRMAAYAALIDRVDQELGRLIKDFDAKGEMQNTLIIFLSDNGACPYDRRNLGKNLPPYEPGAAWSDSTGWAWARNAPFRYYKQNQFEGGIATPAIFHWPAGIKLNPNTILTDPAHLVDVLPTLAEISSAIIPDQFPNRQPSKLAGISLAPLLRGEKITTRPPIHFLFESDRALRDGAWKIVSFKSQPWELYHIGNDRTEVHNLAAKHPDIVARMEQQWHEITKSELQAPAKQQAPVATEAQVHRHPEWTKLPPKEK